MPPGKNCQLFFSAILFLFLVVLHGLHMLMEERERRNIFGGGGGRETETETDKTTEESRKRQNDDNTNTCIEEAKKESNAGWYGGMEWIECGG